MIIERLIVGMLQTNCYLLGDRESGKAVLIDPGAEGERICAKLRELGLQLSAILVTHAHFDHTMAAWTLKNQCGGEIYLNAEDRNSLLEVMFGLAARFFRKSARYHPVKSTGLWRKAIGCSSVPFAWRSFPLRAIPRDTFRSTGESRVSFFPETSLCRLNRVDRLGRRFLPTTHGFGSRQGFHAAGRNPYLSRPRSRHYGGHGDRSTTPFFLRMSG